MENNTTPTPLSTNSRMWLLIKTPTMPTTVNMRRAINKPPENFVKSHFVWQAKSIKPITIIAVKPIAIMALIFEWFLFLENCLNSIWQSYVTEYLPKNAPRTPATTPSAMVSIPRKIKLIGNERRTYSQQAKGIIVTNANTAPTMDTQKLLLTYVFVVSWRQNNSTMPNVMINCTWKKLNNLVDAFVTHSHIFLPIKCQKLYEWNHVE